MDIVIHSLGMPFNGDTVRTKSLGGSESAAYYQARELTARGHRVKIFSTTEQDMVCDGVEYINAGNTTKDAPLGERFEYYARHTPHDVLIIQRHPIAFHNQYASKINIWQLHDLALHRSSPMAQHGMWNIDAVTTVSAWHKKQVVDVYGFHEKIVKVVPNGVDPELYAGYGIEADQVDEMIVGHPSQFNMLYQARPERGLENLVKPGGIMDLLGDTETQLLVCGYDNTVPQMRAFYDKLKRDGEALGNVKFLGALTKPQLAALQQRVDLMIYPTEFEEVSCISVMEAMHAGLPVLASAVGALPETCMNAGVKFINQRTGGVDPKAFADVVKSLMNDPYKELNILKKKQLAAAPYKTWVKAVDKLEAVINEAFEKRRGSLSAQVRHSIEHSDIGFATYLYDHTSEAELNKIDLSSEREINNLYSFTDSPATFAAHYTKHQAVYYDDFEDKVVGEDVTQSTRFRGVAGVIGAEYQRNHDLRVLDYGCAHGHYLVPLAKAMPEASFVGMDVSARAIGAAMKWVQRDGLHNVELRIGAEAELTLDLMCPMKDPRPASWTFGVDGNGAELAEPVGHMDASRRMFDVILAGEVLEHVYDWLVLLEKFSSILNPGGVIVVTTPAGRWEWTGTTNFREAREHLHHFERKDIEELCAGNQVDIVYAPATHDRTGRYLGSWVWAVRPTQEFGTIDFHRKLRQLCPRQTLSACLIVKDGEKTIRKCIESFIDYVDEIVIGVDKTTKDRTRQVLEDLREDFKWKPFFIFEMESALVSGFDEARNQTLKFANGDWIMWCDADEEVQQPWNLWKFLRYSQVDGVGFPQIHYSTNPPQVLTTDYPIRLFRNNGAIRFYGVVHEHPEFEPGKSVPRALVRPDVQFLHSGYVDEETRRARFRRNLPLLHRDLEKFKDRGLNKYLWLRDIAQQLQFELEQTGGHIVEGQVERAMEGIKLYEKMIDSDNIRMVVDALKYYTHCVQMTGKGFKATVQFGAANPTAPDLSTKFDIDAMFYTREHFTRLLNKLNEEATKHYEAKYL